MIIELTSTEVAGFNRITIEMLNKRLGTKEQHILVRPSDLESCIHGIFARDFYGNYYNAPLEKMAALLLMRISQGQFFVNGNKRTAVNCCWAFLRNNGFGITLEVNEVHSLLIGIANRTKTEQDALAWVCNNIFQQE